MGEKIWWYQNEEGSKKKSCCIHDKKTLNFTYLDLTVESGAAVKDVNSGHVYCVFFTSLIRLLKKFHVVLSPRVPYDVGAWVDGRLLGVTLTVQSNKVFLRSLGTPLQRGVLKMQQ